MEFSVPAATVAMEEFVKKWVVDWDDKVKSTAWYKALSGQGSDWEPQFRFWRDLILKISCQFRFLILSPSQLEMHKAGDLVRLADLEIRPVNAFRSC